VKISELPPLGSGFSPTVDVFALVHAGATSKVTPDAVIANYLATGTIRIGNLVVSGTMSLPTGIVAVTQPVDTANTSVATTAFVINQAGTAAPVVDGTPTAGTTTRYARVDHVHPTDASRAPIASPSFTGEVGMPGGAVFAQVVPDASLDLNFLLGLLAGATFNRSTGNATYFDVNGVMQTQSAANVPRFDYDPVSHAPKGLLVEETRTNLFTFSNVITTANGWTAAGLTLATAAGIAPDGANTMSKAAENTTTSFHYVGRALMTVTVGQMNCLSVFAKAAENRYLQIVVDDNSATGAFVTFDLLAGTISTAPSVSGTAVLGGALIQPIGNGVYRCSLATTVGTTSTTLRHAFVLALSGNPGKFPQYAGVAGNGVLIWGAQMETGAFPTSLIPTTSASLTRQFEWASMLTGTWFNQNTGTLAIEWTPPPSQGAPGFSYEILFLDATAASDTMGLRQFGGTQIVHAMAWVANAQTMDLTLPSSLIAGVNRAALAYNRISGLAMVATMNGGGIVNGTPTGLPTFNRMTIGHARAQQLNGWVRRIRYWPRVLSNAESQAVGMPTQAIGLAVDASSVGETTPANATFLRVRTGSVTGPTWTTGTTAPLAAEPVGSLYSRVGGAVGATLYISRGGGTWAAVAGV
jgi:hypothetical protein